MMYVKYPLSLRNVEDLLHERGVDISYETVRFWEMSDLVAVLEATEDAPKARGPYKKRKIVS
jgi:transposase-like protein